MFQNGKIFQTAAQLAEMSWTGEIAGSFPSETNLVYASKSRSV